MEFFKDISDSLALKYPDRKVFVISDQHFDHKNILNYTRKDLFDSDIDIMNNEIISNHNKVVDKDDIVIMLGDFSFRMGNERLKELVSKLNGHKILVMGNHDINDRPDIYLKAGFEEVYPYPIKFNGDYYSHYPLNASIDSSDRPTTLLYNSLAEEFKKSNTGINYHGHQHKIVNNGDREKNVACENVDYKPLFVGRTKTFINLENNKLPYLNEEFFDILHAIMHRYNHFEESTIITDYLYTIILEILTKYQDDIVTFGSLMLNKKYNTNYNPSDLDVTKLYIPNKSNAFNRNLFKEFGYDIYEKLNEVKEINIDFYKKIDFICILSFIYATNKNRYKGYLDMNVLFDEFYKSEDFINISGKSLLEEYANKMNIDTPKTIKYPRFSIETTNALADIVNYYLQYIYSVDNKKKLSALNKINNIIKNIDSNSQIDFDQLQNTYIRFLLRNIYFYEATKRKKESEYVLTNNNIELPNLLRTNNSLSDDIRVILNDKEYHSILNSIKNSSNRKKEITNILSYYKTR